MDRSGLRRRVSWELETRPHTDDRDTTVATVRELLDDIVRRQLVADVPRCTLLSGGLDSSAMTALAARQLAEHGEKVRSFAVDFVGQADHFVADALRGTPDTPFVHDVARAAGTDHQDIVLDAQALADPEVRAKVIRARDLPMGLGDMDASLYLLFRSIRGHSTVALSGESADEVFGGYLRGRPPRPRQGPPRPARPPGLRPRRPGTAEPGRPPRRPGEHAGGAGAAWSGPSTWRCGSTSTGPRSCWTPEPWRRRATGFVSGGRGTSVAVRVRQ